MMDQPMGQGLIMSLMCWTDYINIPFVKEKEQSNIKI
jgi:hypothetical protein